MVTGDPDEAFRGGIGRLAGPPLESVRRAFSLRLAQRYHPRGAVTFANLLAVDAVNAQTLRVTLSKPAPYLLLALSAGDAPPPRLSSTNEHWFPSLFHARTSIESWRRDYNEERPKRALGGLRPAQHAVQLAGNTDNISTGL